MGNRIAVITGRLGVDRPAAPGATVGPRQRRSLRMLLSAYAVSQFGNWLFRTGVVYFAYNRSNGSTAVITTAIVLVYLPILAGSRLLAPMADRRDTRRTLIGLDVLRALLLVVLLVVVSSGVGFVSAATIAAMTLLSLLTPLFVASQSAYLRRILPTDGLSPALANLSKVDWCMFILGTASGPLMLQFTNLPALITLDIVSFVVSALLLIRLMPAAVAPGDDRDGGAAAAAGKPRLTRSSRWLLVSVFALNAGAGVINVYPNVVAREFFGGGAGWLSVINLANGVGAVLGATLAGRLRHRLGLRPGVLAAVVVAVSLAGMMLVTTPWVAILASSTMLAAGQVFAVVFQARILANEPVRSAGRASGFFTLGTFAGVTVNVLLFLGITAVGSLRVSFTTLLIVAAGSALFSAAIGNLAARRHGDGAASGGADTAPAQDAAPAKDPEDKASLVRAAGRTFATGVAVVSTVRDQIPHAATVNSFVTVSLTPPLVLICVDRGSQLHTLLAEQAPLGITILATGQRDAAQHFARRHRDAGEGQFDGHPWTPGPHTGAPLLKNGSAWLECRVDRLVPAGDHSIVLAEVLAFTPPEPDGPGPLLFHGGAFHALRPELPHTVSTDR
jgi:flavin reductase (DIM6/NTAB) family NADH-FMN oxidoreductase RutF/predicted MFS family arabinose efflux permease